MNFKGITVGQYFPGSSPIHRLDPRVKLTAVLILSVAIFLPKAWPGYLATVLFTLGALLASQVPIMMIVRGLKPILIFLMITAVFNLFLTPGDPLFKLGPFTATREGLVMIGLTTMRLIMLVTIASLLTLTTSPIRLTDGMERMLRPFKAIGVPAHELALMMTIALRFIPTLAEEAERIMKAQQARGAEFTSGSVISRVKSLIPVLVPLFVAAFRRADELATAMEARGYRGGEGRTRMRELVYSGGDVVGFLILFAFLGLVIALRITGIG